MLFELQNQDYNYLYSEVKKLKLFNANHRKHICKDGKPPKSNLYGYSNKQLNPNYRIGHEEHHLFKGYYETKLKHIHPEFQLVVDKIADKYFPKDFYFNSVQINKNTNCKRHTDSKNIGYSIILGLGDYIGGELCVEKDDDIHEINIQKKFYIFDGSKYPHWTNDFINDRYSLIFFNNYDFDYRIAIPSYKRPEILHLKTLKYLQECQIDFNKIDLFLKNKNELSTYHNKLKDYKNINIILHEQHGISSTRNYIQSYYHESNNQFVISIDDDIDYLIKKNKKIYKLNHFINTCFGLTIDKNLNLFGINPCSNVFYMKDKITTNLKYIPGGFFGFIVDKNKYIIHSTFDHLEDYQFSIETFLRDGGVLRFNNFSMITKNFEKGGISDTYGGKELRLKATKQLCEEFYHQYGTACRIVKKKDYYNIQLNHHYKIT